MSEHSLVAKTNVMNTRQQIGSKTKICQQVSPLFIDSQSTLSAARERERLFRRLPAGPICGR